MFYHMSTDNVVKVSYSFHHVKNKSRGFKSQLQRFIGYIGCSQDFYMVEIPPRYTLDIHALNGDTLNCGRT